MNKRINDFEIYVLNVVKTYLISLVLEDLTPSFYLVTNVLGIQTMSLKDL